MQIFLKIILLITLISYNLQAQAYLPLQIGNSWTFDMYYIDSNNIKHQEKQSTVIVKKDSIMSNGKTYFLLDGEGSFLPSWVRVDSCWLFYYEKSDSSDYALYNFNSEIGDTFYGGNVRSIIMLKTKDTLTLFNQKIHRLTFTNELGNDNIIQLSFSDKFGPLGGSYYYYGRNILI